MLRVPPLTDHGECALSEFSQAADLESGRGLGFLESAITNRPLSKQERVSKTICAGQTAR